MGWNEEKMLLTVYGKATRQIMGWENCQVFLLFSYFVLLHYLSLYMYITLSKMLQCSLCAKLTIHYIFVAVPTENAEQPRECKFG